jgi:hypothetical protein
LVSQVSPPDVVVGDTGSARGRGVFAQRRIAAEEVVEESPVVLIESPFRDFPAEIKRLVFSWGKLCNNGSAYAVALGYGSMYNHDNPANMRYQADPVKLVMRFIAVRDIESGEELTVNYNAVGGGAEWPNNNWFDRMNVVPIVSR